MQAADAEPIRLSREDRAILALECETIVGHTCKVVLCGGSALPLDALQGHVAKGVAESPQLLWELGGTEAEPAWVACREFDVAEHVTGGGRVPRGDLPGEVARIFEMPLERSRPLWAIDAIDLEEGGTALVWRIHHALADGTAAMRFARAILWDPGDDAAAPGARRPAAAASSAAQPGPVATSAADDERRRRHLARFIDHEFGESLHRSPFDGRIGRDRTIAFASTALGPLHDAAKRLGGATVNDAILAVVSGALRRWIETHHGSLGGVRVRIPVSLHHEGDSAGNRDSFFTVALPLGEPDPAARLRRVHEATRGRKADHDAETMDSLLRGLSGLSPELEHLCKRIESSPRRFAVSVSNVPGPRAPVSVLGAPVESVHSLAEIGRRHALRIAVVSLAGELHFGFCADPHLVPDLTAMATGVEAEAAALIGAAE